MAKKYTLSRKGADKHQLYQCSVQDAEHEVEFTVGQYRKRRGRQPMILREDFCGTALIACCWAQSHKKRRALGLDLDSPTLDWARQHNVLPLGSAASRVDLRQCDVRTVTEPKADVVQAFNFSYYLFHSLTDLVGYFHQVYQSLAPGGVFFLDSYGGWESQQAVRERRTVSSPEGDFGFIWEQADFNPINNRARCYIHFEFKNGKRWKRAFSYDFRLYSPAEVCDALGMAGFSNIEVYWDHSDDDDESDFRPESVAENCPGWLAYILADGPPDGKAKGA
jgi:SAM-dependent methyltransferase